MVEKKSNYKQGYHRELKMLFTILPEGIEFQDGVFYKNSEIQILKNNPGFDYETIHECKKLFDAEVVI